MNLWNHEFGEYIRSSYKFYNELKQVENPTPKEYGERIKRKKGSKKNKRRR